MRNINTIALAVVSATTLVVTAVVLVASSAAHPSETWASRTFDWNEELNLFGSGEFTLRVQCHMCEASTSVGHWSESHDLVFFAPNQGKPFVLERTSVNGCPALLPPVTGAPSEGAEASIAYFREPSSCATQR